MLLPGNVINFYVGAMAESTMEQRREQKLNAGKLVVFASESYKSTSTAKRPHPLYNSLAATFSIAITEEELQALAG